MAKILLKNCRAVLETSTDPVPKDILIEGCFIIDVADRISGNGWRTIDCQGKIVLPSLFDLHVHLREPGFEEKETIATGCQAAINGGITGLLAMPNTRPVPDNRTAIQSIKKRIAETAGIDVHLCGAISEKRQSRKVANLDSLAEAGITMISDDGDPVKEADLLKDAMEKAKKRGIRVCSHCEIPAFTARGVINEGAAHRLHLPPIPPVSEELCIERDLTIAAQAGCPIHIQHVSTARGIEIIDSFKKKGMDITCEVTPHHLLFSEDDLSVPDANYKMNPPLRRPEDAAALLEALNNGIIDCIATDHAPHTEIEKKKNIIDAPFGITGLETALISLYARLIAKGKLQWNTLVKAFALTPRSIMGLAPVALTKGSEASLIIFNENRMTICNRLFFRSKSVNTPFFRKELSGCIEQVFYKGNSVLQRNDT